MRKYYSRLIISLLTGLFGMRAALLPFALLKTQVASAATDYYVATTGSDSNPGTQSQPFKTIRKGSQVATAGTTVHVAAGTYTETIRTTQSGTASSRIRFVSYVKWGAKIIPPANSTSEYVWDIRGNYVDINGFEVDGSNCTSCTDGIYLAGSYDRVTNTHVHNIANNIPCYQHGAAGITADHYYGGIRNDIIGNVVHHIGVDQCDFYQGIYMSTSGMVANNIVNNVSAYGIHLWHDATNVTIVNNTVFNNGSVGSAGGGMVIGSGEYYNFSGPGDYNIVANNIVYNNRGVGIQENGNTGIHNTYTNNLVYGNTTNWRLQNGLTHTNTVTADPRFVNYLTNGTGKYHLAAGSPAIDRGIKASYVPTTDFDVAIRPQGAAPDIGAYEKAAAGPSGPVGWWKLDETSGTTASDSSGNGNTGTLINGPVRTTGKIGNALSFDGVNDYVNIGDPASGVLDFGTGSFSYGMWIYPTRLINWEVPWWKGGSSIGETGYDIELNASGKLSAGLSDGSTSTLTPFYTSGTPLNQWIHIFAVVDRTAQKIKVYTNGAFVRETDLTGFGSVSSTNAATIGAAGAGSSLFKGRLDDVRIYNRALSAQEISDLYTQ